MNTKELNIAKALQTAKEALTKMISQGIKEPHHIFALSNMLSSEYSLNQNESIIVIEEALKIS